MPIPLVKDDRLRLADQEGITLTVLAGDTRIDVRDGHNLTVIDWTGVYAGEGGLAEGAMVSTGPLQGWGDPALHRSTKPVGALWERQRNGPVRGNSNA